MSNFKILPICMLAGLCGVAESAAAAPILEQFLPGTGRASANSSLGTGVKSYDHFTLEDTRTLRRISWQGTLRGASPPGAVFTIGLYRADGPPITGNRLPPGTSVFQQSDTSDRITELVSLPPGTVSSGIESLYELDLDMDVILEAGTTYWLTVFDGQPGSQFTWSVASPSNTTCCLLNQLLSTGDFLRSGNNLSFGLYDDPITPIDVVTEVPAPGVLALFGLGLLGLGARRYRNSASSPS